MKKILIILFAFIATFSLTSCNDHLDDDLPTTPQLVTVSLNYTFNNTVTRATNNDLYTQLYNGVLSKDLLDDYFVLTFRDISTGETYNFKGNWKTNNKITIKTGRYKVNGYCSGVGTVVQNECSVKFNTEIEINTHNPNIFLIADYDCFLVIFNKDAIKNAYVQYAINNTKTTEINFFEYNNILYGFARKLYNEESSAKQYLVIDFNDDERVSLDLKNLNFKNGEYYVFDDNIKYKNQQSSSNISLVLSKMNFGNI